MTKDVIGVHQLRDYLDRVLWGKIQRGTTTQEQTDF